MPVPAKDAGARGTMPRARQSRFAQTWESWLFGLIALAGAAAAVLALTGRVRLYAGDTSGGGQLLLSSLLQSLAAILGVAFTLTLIGVQLAAQTYTHRIIRLHTRSPVFVTTFAVFIAGIVYTAVLNSAHGRAGDAWVDLAVVLFATAVLLLVPFAVRTIRLLSPGNIAYALLGRVTPRQLGRADSAAVHDGVGPVFDMARKAVVGRDERTLELLLAELRCRTVALARSPELGPDGMKTLVAVLGPEFRDLGWLASDHLAIGAVGRVVDSCREIICEVGGQPEHRAMADALYDAIKDIWKEALVRFGDKAYEARLAELRESMNTCQLDLAEVLK